MKSQHVIFTLKFYFIYGYQLYPKIKTANDHKFTLKWLLMYFILVILTATFDDVAIELRQSEYNIKLDMFFF